MTLPRRRRTDPSRADRRSSILTGKPPVRIALFAALAALVLVLVPTAFAGKPSGHSGSGSGSINLVLLNSSDGLPHYGQQVTFSVSTSASQPWVDLECNQGSTWVYGSWAGFFPGYTWGQTFT